MFQNYKKYIGKYLSAADGSNYGIFIIGALPEAQDFVVILTIDKEIQYQEKIRRLDFYKATSRYVLDLEDGCKK